MLSQQDAGLHKAENQRKVNYVVQRHSSIQLLRTLASKARFDIAWEFFLKSWQGYKVYLSAQKIIGAR